MFQHTMVTSQSEYKCTICHGWREPLPEWDLLAEPTAIKLVNPNSQHQDIDALYWDDYQLCRLPGWGRCKEAAEEWLHKEDLDSIKECLRLKWPPTQQEKQQMQLLANTPRPDSHTVFAAMNHKTYEEMIALARDAWQWVLVAAVILEECMERMSCSTSHCHSTSHQCSTSHGHLANHRKSRSSGWWEEGSQVTPCCGETEATSGSSQANSHQEGMADVNFFKHQRDTAQEWMWSPSSIRWRHWVTFAKGTAPSLEESLRHEVSKCPHDAGTEMGYQLSPPMWWTEATPQEMADWSRPWEEAQTVLVKEEDVDLECTPPLEPYLMQLLGEEEPSLPGTNARDVLPPLPMPEDPEPSPQHASDWIEWHARYVQMPSWWEELTKIPSNVNHQEFAWKVHASFEVPKACN